MSILLVPIHSLYVNVIISENKTLGSVIIKDKIQTEK